MSFKKEVLKTLGLQDPFEGYNPEYELDTGGFVYQQEFEQITHLLKEKEQDDFIHVEVGSWKGDSALQMATHFKDNGLNGVIICLDTWLGALEHLVSDNTGIIQYYNYGYPSFYYQFLSNVKHYGLEDYIIPIATTSVIGLRYLRVKRLKVDSVYLDGSHEYDDVYLDCKESWYILKDGGYLFGDDFGLIHRGVIKGVSKFEEEKDLQLHINHESGKWMTIKGVTRGDYNWKSD